MVSQPWIFHQTNNPNYEFRITRLKNKENYKALFLFFYNFFLIIQKDFKK